MKEAILNELNRIENEHSVKILYAVESGSRGWGFESTDSDYDVRFIYISKLNWYLSMKEKRDVIEVPIDEVLDVNGWDIQKALMLYKRSNPTLLEWLSSPIVYMQDTSFADNLRELMNDYFISKSCIYHYLSMAKGNYREYLKKDYVKIKKYFYVIRPLMACMWIEEHGSQPPMLFEELMTSLEIPSDVIDEIKNLLERKKISSELKEEARIPLLNQFIEEKIEYFEELAKSLEYIKNNDVSQLDDLFLNTLDEAWNN
ncbi:nucleotidyltransferase domain-containing protein [Vallitaleaceae bacterium 9-2]